MPVKAPYRLREAETSDAPAILEIYDHYVKNTVISFELETPPLTEFENRIRTIKENHPYILAERDGLIIGYAYAARHQSRAAYQWNAELSVYIHQNHTGQGLGPALYNTLIDLAGAMNLRNVYGCVATPNPASEKLHARLGFVTEGVFRRTGFKFGQWHDVTWFGKRLAEYPDPPAQPLSIQRLPARLVGDILDARSI